jgi:hypothetical protein
VVKAEKDEAENWSCEKNSAVKVTKRAQERANRCKEATLKYLDVIIGECYVSRSVNGVVAK